MRVAKSDAEHMDMCTKPSARTGPSENSISSSHDCLRIYFETFFIYRSDSREYALKLIEGTGISMSACREIAVRTTKDFWTNRTFTYNPSID
jgi:hypothetical protein